MDADTITPYRQAVIEVIRYYGQFVPAYGEIRNELIIATEQDHYALIHVGWDKHRRVHGMVIHIDIIDGKIWIQWDGTEIGVANDLVDAGIPREAIVLAFHHPKKRKYTDFAEG